MSGFRLAGLLRLRALAEERAAVQLAQATRARDAARAVQRSTTEQLAGTALPARADPRTVAAALAARTALGGLLVHQQALVQDAETELREADRRWSVARSRTRALEKLAQRHSRAERAAEQRAEQHVLDEVAGRRPARPDPDRPAGPTTPPQEDR